MARNAQNMNTFRKKISTYLQPLGSTIYNCTLLHTPNLAYSEWMSINCFEPLLDNVVCFTKNLSNSGLHSNLGSSSERMFHCSKNDFLKNKKCFQFVWFDGSVGPFTATYVICTNSQMHLVFESAFNFSFVFHGLCNQNFNLLSVDILKQRFMTISFETFWFGRSVKQQPTDKLSKGFFVCGKSATMAQMETKNLHKCLNDRIISNYYLCDFQDDCFDAKLNSSDENTTWCQVFKKYAVFPFKQKSFASSGEMFSEQNIKNFVCHEGLSINTLLVDDLVPDCGLEAEDEPALKQLLRQSIFTECTIPGEISCRHGHSKCFNISRTCLYKIGNTGHLEPCRTGEHLADCKLFECNARYKCPEFFCIPHSYVCDGKWDCPNGEDEMASGCRNDRICEHMFKCRNTLICIHIGNTCDKKEDCPLKDDELLCDVRNTCPKNCHCYHYALVCANVQIIEDSLSALLYFVIHIHFTSLTNLDFLSSQQWPNLIILNVSQNAIQWPCNVLKLHKLLTVFHASVNEIETLSVGCFEQLPNMKEIYLDRNQISDLGAKSFSTMFKILCIDLSHNKLFVINKNVFHNISNLYELNLNRNPLTELTLEMFDNVVFSLLITGNFRLCCITSGATVCCVPPPWYTSCFELLPDIKMRVSFVAVSIVIIVTNFSTKMLFEKKTQVSFYLVVCFIKASYAICGIYLLIVWVADVSYGKDFVRKDLKWR